MTYRGRFAPSPTGPLHFGSLFAALISYLDAKYNQGQWLLRIEDIDPLRESPEASQLIVAALEAHGLLWDEAISYQSANSQAYEQALAKLHASGHCFFCPCSRKQLAAQQGQHNEACQRQGVDKSQCAIKFAADNKQYEWLDAYQGPLSLALDEDFVLKRKEGFYAYQLAVVCDDVAQGISHVVRGYDLLTSTPMQLALYQALNARPPEFAHFPLICTQGQKLSKQNLAKAIEPSRARENLKLALQLLGLNRASQEASVSAMLATAIATWNPDPLKRQIEIDLPEP